MLRLLLKGEDGGEKRVRLKWLHVYVIIHLSGHQKMTFNKRPIYNQQQIISTEICNEIIEELLRYNSRDLHVLKHASIKL
jgi:hypothetical protein